MVDRSGMRRVGRAMCLTIALAALVLTVGANAASAATTTQVQSYVHGPRRLVQLFCCSNSVSE